MPLSIDRLSGAELILRGHARRVEAVGQPAPGRLVEFYQDMGLVYAIQASTRGSPVKVGYCHDWGLRERLKGLQTGNPDRLRVLASAPGYLSHEQRAHRALSPFRLTGEWFRWSPPVCAFVAEMKKRGVEYAIAAAKIAQEKTR